MQYTHTTFAQLDALLQNRIDTDFWVEAERKLYLVEALRTWQALTGFYRQRATFSTIAGDAFYNLQDEIPLVFEQSVTDSNLVEIIQYQLVEPATGTSWTGTEMFTLGQVEDALEKRRDHFLEQTGMVVSSAPPPPPGPAPSALGRVILDDDVIDVRRLVWKPSTGKWSNVWRSDERQFTTFSTSWSSATGDPSAYSVMASRPVEIQLNTVPSASGDLHMVTVRAGAALDASNGVVMGLPNDWCWVVKFGALADLLSKDGQARDPQRADYCEARYAQGVELARTTASVVHAEIAGTSLMPSSLTELDSFDPGWEGGKRKQPVQMAMAGHNLVAFYRVPDTAYSVDVDVVGNFPVPVLDVDYVQVGREQLNAIIDYAEHLAAFKMGGAEFAITARLLKNFLEAAKVYNSRITASAPSAIETGDYATRDEQALPRRQSGTGVGTYA